MVLKGESMKRSGRERFVALFLVVAVIAVYFQVMGHDFVNLDDGLYVIKNYHTRVGLSVSNVIWAFKNFEAFNWHPLTWLSHLLDVELYGLNPAGHHLTSLFFHLANTMLLFLALIRLTGKLWESAAVTALFAVHPIHVESVAWVSERKDVLSGFFWMLCMIGYVEYCKSPTPRRYALILLLFGFALMSKAMVVTLPFVLLLLDIWPLERLKSLMEKGRDLGSALRRLIWEKTPLFLMAGVVSVLTYVAQAQGEAMTRFEAVSFKIRFLNALLSYVRYLEKTFWPHDLAVFYPHLGNNFPIWHGVAAGVFLLALTLLIMRNYRTRPYLPMGWLWFMGTLVPVIGLVQVGGQALADRYTYLPSIGLFIAVVWLVSDLMREVRWKKQAFAIGGGAIFLILCFLTEIQVGYWENSETLFRHAIAATDRNYLGYCNLGPILVEQGKLSEAEKAYKKALEIWPYYADAHNNLGVLRGRQGMYEEAIRHYQDALQANPKHMTARTNLARLFSEMGYLDKANLHYDKALQIKPDSFVAHNGKGLVLAKMNKMEDAIKSFRQSVKLCPICAEACNNLGRALMLKAEYEEAIEYLRRALQLRPTYAEAYNNLGLVYVRKGELETAVRFFSCALYFRPDYKKARDNLGRIVSLEPFRDEGKKHGHIKASDPWFHKMDAFDCPPAST